MNPKNKELIERLIDNTDQGKLQWEKTNRSAQFMACMSKVDILVMHDLSLNKITYTFAIETKEGSTIDFIKASEKESTIFVSDDFILLSNIYEKARRNALNIDKTIDDILGELN